MTSKPTVMETNSPQNCRNCGSPVSVNYCSTCGQRIEDHLHSLWDFMGEIAEAFSHADSRLWRTLAALLFAPGLLTEQFLAGRRASYLAPFRLYLVISVGFFFVVSITTAPRSPDVAEARTVIDSRCRESVAHVPGPPWIRERFLHACEASQVDHGRQLTEDFIHNLGRAMFVLLPLLAALMKLMYWRPQRAYLFHLVLLIHNQACMFLFMTVAVLGRLWFPSNAIVGWIQWLVACYLVFYLYRSMRRVYGESRARTLVKFSALSLAYVVCAASFVFVTGLYSAESL